ncbi:MAG: GNAT family N-acetyltransferase [Candidatus Lokiarchaeota archaeon]|nr:GNAT family N-acetyltransferase [Candidatus Lokiarchaeota archaeon]
MQIRRAKLEDKDGYIKNARYSYNAPEKYEDLMGRKFEQYTDQYYTVRDGDRVLANGRVIPFKQNIRGVLRSMGGIASISSAPETRRQGHVREMVKLMLTDMNEEGVSFSTLYPFKDEFYARFGYVPMPPFHRIQLRVDLMRRWEIPEGYYLKMMPLEEGLEYAKIVHREAITGIHGTVVRSDARWKEHAMRDDIQYVFAFTDEGRPIAFMSYSNKNYGAFGDDDRNGMMYVHGMNMYWSILTGRNMLLNFIHNHSDQVVTVTIPVYPVDQDYWHWTRRFNIGDVKVQAYNIAMARIINVERMITGLPSGVKGNVFLKVTDATCPWNEGVYSFSCDGLTLQVKRVNENEHAEISIEGLTSLVLGTAPLATIRELQQLEGEKVEILGTWFRPTMPWFTEDF